MRKSKTRQAAVALGFRSGFEAAVAKDLEERGIEYEYEKDKLLYHKQVRGGLCGSCGSNDTRKRGTYTPDFRLAGCNFYVECKGRFTASDRTKLLAVRASARCAGGTSPDIRLLYQADNYTTKLKRERYSEWATRNGFVWAVGKSVPTSWVQGTEGNADLLRSPKVLSSRTRRGSASKPRGKRATQSRTALALGKG